jgi:non-ribosomal peptide synthetase component F
MPNDFPYTNVDLQEVASRNDTARHIVAGCTEAFSALADVGRQLEAALADTPALSAEVRRLSRELQTTRLDRANLLAAIQATLAAYADGEADPLAYLRDELDARQAPAPDTGEAS